MLLPHKLLFILYTHLKDGTPIKTKKAKLLDLIPFQTRKSSVKKNVPKPIQHQPLHLVQYTAGRNQRNNFFNLSKIMMYRLLRKTPVNHFNTQAVTLLLTVRKMKNAFSFVDYQSEPETIKSTCILKLKRIVRPPLTHIQPSLTLTTKKVTLQRIGVNYARLRQIVLGSPSLTLTTKKGRSNVLV